MNEIAPEKHELFNINPVVVLEFLTPEECRQLVSYFQKGEKESGKLRASSRKSDAASEFIRNNSVCWIERIENNSWIYDKVSSLLLSINNQKYHFTIDTLQMLQLAEYRASNGETGQYYKSHIDTCISGWVESQRKLSLTVQLTPDQSYEGGDLLLFGDQNDIILNPENFKKNIQQRREYGAAIIFPSFFQHEVTPVTKGTRYSLVAWMHGPNWK